MPNPNPNPATPDQLLTIEALVGSIQDDGHSGHIQILETEFQGQKLGDFIHHPQTPVNIMNVVAKIEESVPAPDSTIILKSPMAQSNMTQ